MSELKITPTMNDVLGSTGFTPSAGAFAFPLARDPLHPKKVAILGTQPASRMMAPYNDPTWTIWGSSPGNMGLLPRVDAWFELHVNLLWAEYKSYGEPYVRWLKEQTFPVVCWDQRYVQNAVPYPRLEMVKRFGPYFFSSTFAWMMAYAIHVGVEELGLFGVDMSSKDEYIQQRPGGHYFIQRAQEAGIKLIVPDESDLLQPPPLYGYAESTPFARKMAARKTEVRDRLSQVEPQIGSMQQQAVYLRGALENMDYMIQVWGGIADMEYFNRVEEVKPLQVVVSPPLQPSVEPQPSVIHSAPTAPSGNSGGEHDQRAVPDL